jgi:hypothetical protein
MIVYPLWHGFHAFRRGLATSLYDLGVDDFMIQQVLRQADVETTRRHYIKALPAQSVAAMAKLEASLPESCAGRDAGSKQASGLVVLFVWFCPAVGA